MEKFDYSMINKDEFFKAPVYFKKGSKVLPTDLVKCLKTITGVDFSNITKESKKLLKDCKPHTKMKKSIYRIRIFEDCLRVRDYSVYNCKIVQGENKVTFEFTDLGEERNHCIIADRSDVYLHTNGLICINVHGPVYYADGTRRYQNRRNDI